MLCGRSGFCYDFIVYQGSTTELSMENLKNFGFGATVVLHFKERYRPGQFLFFDNYFTTYNLLELLAIDGIKAAGTVRINRFGKPPLTNSKEIKKLGRGSSEEIVSVDEQIVLTRWYDNKDVFFGSNFVGLGQKDLVERWDGNQKKYIKIERPEVVKLYNQSMGGVDKFDQLMSYYRIRRKSKKWTLRMIFHAVDMAIVNSWSEYKERYKELGINKNAMDLLEFRKRLALNLIHLHRTTLTKKRGRPSSTHSSPSTSREHTPILFSKKSRESIPIKEHRLDSVAHFPDWDTNVEASRCKRCKTGKTHVICSKCQVHLCFVRTRNCFKLYHLE